MIESVHSPVEQVAKADEQRESDGVGLEPEELKDSGTSTATATSTSTSAITDTHVDTSISINDATNSGSAENVARDSTVEKDDASEDEEQPPPAKKQKTDESAEEPQQPKKRGRGRPPGSKTSGKRKR